MIEINLLPAKVQRAKGVQQWYYVVGAGGVLLFAIVGFLYFTAIRQTSKLEGQIASVKKEQDAYKTVLAKVERVHADEKLRDEQLARVKSLIERQVYWLRVAQDINDSIPPSAWLVSVKSQGQAGKLKDVELEIQGNAVSKGALEAFLQGLAQKSSFSTVTLKSAQDSVAAGYNLWRFTVMAKIGLPG